MTRNLSSLLAPDRASDWDYGVAAAAPTAAPETHLLIVDDVAENRAILARRFQRRGFRVTEAAGGLDAIELIRHQTFDLVLLDVMMPDLNGLEVLKQIRERHSPVSLPVIMVTVKTLSEDVVQALALGANDYLTKPVDFAVALARVSTQVGRKRAEEEILAANHALSEANAELERRVIERTAKLVEANRNLELEIARREQTQAEIQCLAHYDPLTGLANRSLFRQQLQEAFAQVALSDEVLAVLFLDLDGFKTVNDTLGHSIGDELLKSVARRLRDGLAATDRIARLGGDEFAVVQIAGEQPQRACALADRLIALLSRPYSIAGHDLVIGVSVGIAISQAAESDPEQLLGRADLAMYSAKAAGRGTYRRFEPAMDAAINARRKLEMDLRAALVQGQFELYYQPLVDVRTNAISGFEALLRWDHPQRGIIRPAEFIAVAEETGLIVSLGEWALRQACAEAATWPDEMKVAVNLSAVQFKSGNIVATVMNALGASGLPPNRLELEITESVLLDKAEANLAILNQLRLLGVRICMDDFGSGYSSLSYFRAFRFDKIKIDQSFIDDVADRDGSLAIMRAVVGLAVSFSLSTTAEGIETQDQLDWVKAQGCTEVQGYVFSAARPVRDIRRLLANPDRARAEQR